MDKKLANRLLGIAAGGLLSAGILFLGLELFRNRENNMYLLAGLSCVSLGNLFNIARHYLK